jgi:flagellar biosynthesis/type III secretory pathway protein FliH
MPGEGGMSAADADLEVRPGPDAVDRWVCGYVSQLERIGRRLVPAGAGAANLKPEQKEEVMEIVTSWERRGIEKGFQQGILQGVEKGLQQGIERGMKQGIEKGRIETLREVLLDLLTSRFGALDESVAAKIRETDSADQLRRLTHQALTATSLRELGL